MLDYDSLRLLAQKAQSGDRESYRQFLLMLYPFIRSILKKKLGGIVESEDVTQECLLGVHRHLNTYNPEKPIGPWLSALIRYKVADHFRVCSKMKLEPLNDEIIDAKSVTDDTEATNNQLMECVMKLPSALQNALILTKIQGLDYAEAAKIEGISEPALRKRISRAYLELKAIIEKEPSFAD